MQGVSVVIITRNEERNIGRCITSVKEVADEVIVVDAESNDRTCVIANELGAQVVSRRWTDYSDQKNFANGLAQHPYILSLDADEALSPQLIRSLMSVKRSGFAGAYSVNRLTNYAGHWVRHGGWYPDTKVRLFPKSAVRWEGQHVHETLEVDQGTRVALLEGDLLHYSYPSVDDHEQRIERYSALHARKMFSAGKRTGVVKLWLSPLAKFFQGYLLQLGFLDGWAGWKIAVLSAKAVYLKYHKLKMLHLGQDA